MELFSSRIDKALIKKMEDTLANFNLGILELAIIGPQWRFGIFSKDSPGRLIDKFEITHPSTLVKSALERVAIKKINKIIKNYNKGE